MDIDTSHGRQDFKREIDKADKEYKRLWAARVLFVVAIGSIIAFVLI